MWMGVALLIHTLLHNLFRLVLSNVSFKHMEYMEYTTGTFTGAF